MGGQYFSPGKPSGFQYDKQNKAEQGYTDAKNGMAKNSKSDEDLIIEDNTVYEVDRDCYERLKRQRKR